MGTNDGGWPGIEQIYIDYNVNSMQNVFKETAFNVPETEDYAEKSIQRSEETADKIEKVFCRKRNEWELHPDIYYLD